MDKAKKCSYRLFARRRRKFLSDVVNPIKTGDVARFKYGQWKFLERLMDFRDTKFSAVPMQ